MIQIFLVYIVGTFISATTFADMYEKAIEEKQKTGNVDMWEIIIWTCISVATYYMIVLICLNAWEYNFGPFMGISVDWLFDNG